MAKYLDPMNYKEPKPLKQFPSKIQKQKKNERKKPKQTRNQILKNKTKIAQSQIQKKVNLYNVRFFLDYKSNAARIHTLMSVLPENKREQWKEYIEKIGSDSPEIVDEIIRRFRSNTMESDEWLNEYLRHPEAWQVITSADL